MTEEKINELVKEYMERELIRQSEGIHTNTIIGNLKKLYMGLMSVYNNINDTNTYDYDLNKFSKCDVFDSISLVNKVLKSNYFDIDMNSLYSNGVLNPIYKENINEYKDTIIKYLEGRLSMEGKNYSVEYPSSNTLFDAIILIHEKGHFINKPNNRRTLLSETTSIYLEKVMCEELDNLGFTNESNLMRSVRYDTIKNNINGLLSDIMLLDTYITFGSINKENFNKLYKMNYEEVLKSTSKESFYRVERLIPYIIGLYLSGYMLNKTKEDPSFKYNIKVFSENMFSKSYQELFCILGIDNLDKSFIESNGIYINSENNSKVK